MKTVQLSINVIFVVVVVVVVAAGCRRSVWNGRVEIVYVSSSQAVVKSMGDQDTPLFNPVVIRTQPGLEIESVRRMVIESSALINVSRFFFSVLRFE